MTKYNELKQLYSMLISHFNNIDSEFQVHLKKLKDEYNMRLYDEKIKLLYDICKNENLDFELLQEKYIKSDKTITKLKTSETKGKKKMSKVIDNRGLCPTNTMDINTEKVLHKISINDIDYYCSDLINGEIYDKDLNIIGIIKDSVINL